MKPKIFVIGDHIIDKYVFGSVNRISPEAPVPVLKYDHEEIRVGGAGNVVRNIKSLGGDIKYFTDKKKIIKTRFVSDNQHLLRLDEEDIKDHEYTLNELKTIREACGWADIITLQDYGKGTITPILINEIAKYRDKTIVDPCPKNKSLYRNVKLITPNEYEVRLMSGEDDADYGAKKLISELETIVLMTQGEKGMSLVTKTGTKHYDADKVELRDVTGAGDSVLATLAVYLAKNKPLTEAVYYANKAGGITVRHLGVYSVKHEELEKI